MEEVTSADGTTIAYERQAGHDGRPVVCLHGTGVTGRVWYNFVTHYAGDRPLVVPDRRGRRASGDADTWALEREVDDIVAVADAVADGPVTLFGSSFGGLPALRAAERTPVDQLVLYEPPLATADEAGPRSNLTAEIDRRVAAGDREGAVRLFFEAATGAEQIERWPIWPDCVDLAETVARECHAVEQFSLEGHAVSTPTLLLRGRHSMPYLQAATDRLADRLPNTQVSTVDAAHAGVATAPEDVVAAVTPVLG